MFRRQRKTQRQKRHTYTQRGGAAWPTAPDTWKGVLDLDTIDLTGDASIKTYITIVEKQDHLFRAALNAIYTQFGLEPTDNEEKILTQVKTPTNSIEYTSLNDIVTLIRFKAITPDTTTKFGAIITNKNIIELLLNPAQVTNGFIADLAAACIVQKHDTSIISALSDANILSTRALRYESINEANSRSTTSAKSRDGFYLGQPILRFRAICGYDKEDISKGFWYHFLLQCKELATAPAWSVPYVGDEDSLSEVKSISGVAAGTLKYAWLAAAVFNVYNKSNAAEEIKQELLGVLLNKLPNKDGDLYVALQAVGGMTTRSAGTSPTETVNAPNSSEFQKRVIGDITLEAILKKMCITDLQFVVHLLFTIKDIETSVLEQIGITPTPVQPNPFDEVDQQPNSPIGVEQPSSPEIVVPAAPTSPPRTDGSPSVPQG